MNSDSGEPDQLFNRSSLPQGIGAEPAKISPVQWDNLPKPSPGISRVATQAPGSSEKGSGLVDLSALRDELAKSKKSKPAAPAPKPAAKAPARLAVSAKAGGNSGLIDVAALKDALDQQEAEAAAKAAAKAKAAAATGDAASEVPSFGGQDVDVGDGDAAVASSGASSKMLYMIVGLLVVVAGMLGYLATT